MKNKWTYNQYALFRIIFGLYLMIHFINLLPWGSELFSNQGMLPEASLSPLYNLFPSLLLINDSPLAVTAFIVMGIAGSACLMLGKWDRYAALLNWYILTSLFDRNPLIANPSLPYIGWLLIAHACLPRNRGDEWRMPPGIFFAAWLAMALGYSYSGYAKLTSPSWVDGSAFHYVLTNPLARSNLLTTYLLHLPETAIKCLTWGALAAELLFAPLALVSRARPWIWLTLFGMHAGLLFILRFADLTFGMIILHLFTFDPGWIKPKAQKGFL